jgi:hypothetical protein
MKQKAIYVAVAGALMLGVVGGAQANFLGYASTQISNFQMIGSGLSLGTGSVEANTSANWGEFSESDADSSFPNPAALDVEASACGPGPGGCAIVVPPNQFTLFADASKDNWARSDSNVPSVDILGDGGTSLLVAEVVAAPGVTTPFPVSAATNNSLNASFNFNVAQATDVTFLFDAETFWQTFTPGGKDISTVSSAFNFSLSVDDAGGKEVFVWTPDGVTDALAGEINDPFKLTDVFGSTNGIASSNSVSSNSTLATPMLGQFQARVSLLAGNYQLNIQHGADADGAQVAIPVPATLMLLGAGLVGLGWSRRQSVRV